MHYALYRKYRPGAFDEMVGQDFITSTLCRQVAEGTFAHAYLFTGTRGTGKTSCARILARAVNCLSPRDGNPCNECEICKGLLSGGITDITEIDAASNNSVDDIRRMREEIMYLPAAAKYKVYIIDEVHMLTGAAFNALLKTLEEPPDHAVFILATTEAHKVPATILSRCQRFDFRRISSSVISKRISDILAEEGKALDERTIRLVAELGDGSMRDSLSILEKVMDVPTYEQAEEVLGVIGRRTLYSLIDMTADGNVAGIFAEVDELYEASKDLSLLCSELMREYRSLLLLLSGAGCEDLIDCSDEDLQTLRGLSTKYTRVRVLYAIDVLQGALAAMPRSADKRADTEIALLHIALPDMSTSASAVLARLEKLETDFEKISSSKGYSGPAQTVNEQTGIGDYYSSEKEDPGNNEVKTASVKTRPARRPVTEKKPVEPKLVKPEPKTQETASVPEPETVDHTSAGVYRELASWSEICDYIKDRNMLLSLTLRNECCAVYRGSDMVIVCGEECDRNDVNDPRALALIKEAFEAMRKSGYTIRVELGRKSDYLSTGELYEHAEDSGLFDFTEEI